VTANSENSENGVQQEQAHCFGSNLSLDDSRWRETGSGTLRERKSLVAIYDFFHAAAFSMGLFEPAQGGAFWFALGN
jgi:hypothetical protein